MGAGIARRHLGDTVRGPQFTDLGRNWEIAKEFFTKDAQSYMEYKQQCMSLRTFLFPVVLGGCVLKLYLDPPKSSYWQRYSPRFLWSHLVSTFAPSSPPVFLSAKAEHDIDVPELVKELITTRRLPKSEDSSDDEH